MHILCRAPLNIPPALGVPPRPGSRLSQDQSLLALPHHTEPPRLSQEAWAAQLW